MVSSSRATTRRTCTAPSNLKITLQFYRDWLKGESYLRNDDTWKTYCAEHVTIITNCRETPDELECLSYRQLQRRCMNAKRQGLNIACNSRKSAMLAALKELGVRN